MTRQQAAEFAARIDRLFEQNSHNPPPTIGKPEHPTTLLRDIREALR